MHTFKKRALYILWSAVAACAYFVLSYYILFLDIAKGNVLVATIGNMAFIVIILIIDKLETYLTTRLKSKMKGIKPSLTNKILSGVAYNVSIKSGLYFFYIVLLICDAIVAAEPDFPTLGHMSDYFSSTDYGILVLIAADTFLSQVFKDADKKQDTE